MNKSKHLGLLGGTFDPVHKAHIHLALSAKKEFELEKVIMVPSGQPPHKKYHYRMTDKEDRYEMLRLVCEDYEVLEPDRYEIDKKELCFTYDSLLYFKDKYPDYQLSFIMGEDSLFDIEKWKNPKGIMSLVRLLVAKRYDDYDMDIESQKVYLMEKYSANIEIISKKTEYISSTLLRERLSSNLDCGDFIPIKAIEFIKRKGLYGN